MSLAEIKAAIPHRKPMLLVDEIIARGDNYIICGKTFRDDEFFFQGHYPAHPLVPGVILCETAMQAGAILASQLAPAGGGKVPVVTRLNEVKFRRMIRPGDTIQMEVTVEQRLLDALFLRAKVTCNGELAVRFEFAFTFAEVR